MRRNLPKLAVMRRRVVLGLILAVAGICFGVAGLVFTSSVVAVIASLLAVAGCFLVGGTTLLPLLQKHEDAEGLSDRIDAVMSPRLDPTGAAGIVTQGGVLGSVIDPVTEMPDARYFEVAVDGRVAAARRHLWPVSIVLIQLGFDPQIISTAERDRSLRSFADIMRQTLRAADICCRLDENTFGLILEDTSEEGGVWTAERLQIALSHDITRIRRLVAGVAAYPTHGLFSKDVLIRAQSALTRASSTPAGHGLGQVEVAHVDLS